MQDLTEAYKTMGIHPDQRDIPVKVTGLMPKPVLMKWVGVTCDQYGDWCACVRPFDSMMIELVHPSMVKM